MTLREEAVRLDVSDRPIEALKAYERARVAGELTLEDCLNVAGLCLELADPGYAASVGIANMQNLPELRSIVAQVLREADGRFGPTPDVTFMRAYADFVLNGIDFPEDQFKEIGPFQTFDWGAFWRVVSGICRDRTSVESLLSSLRGESTVARRRIESILRGVLARSWRLT